MTYGTVEQKAEWYDKIAPRLSNFANDLPEGYVERGVDVLWILRNLVSDNASKKTAAVTLDVDDLSVFLMCVDQFWKVHKNSDIRARLEANQREAMRE